MELTDYLRRALPGAGALWAAVSGGRDSVALAHGLWSLGRLDGLVHFNHRMRPESDGEARAVEQWAHRLNVPFFGGSAAERYEGSGVGETWARRQRYAFFDALLARFPEVHLCLAHHRDDQALTVLTQLARGGGVRSLSGMKARRGPYLRPLLECPRSEIDRYTAAHGLSYVDDPTNTDLRGARASLQFLVQSPDAPFDSRRLAETAKELQALTCWMEAQARDWWHVRAVSVAPWVRSVPLRPLRELPRLMRREVLRYWAGTLRLPGLPLERFKGLSELIEKNGRFVFQWGSATLAARDGNLIVGPCARRDGKGLTLTSLKAPVRWGGWTVSPYPLEGGLALAGRRMETREGPLGLWCGAIDGVGWDALADSSLRGEGQSFWLCPLHLVCSGCAVL